MFLRQWQQSAVTADSLREYLSRVGRRSLVLAECVSRVPPEPAAARLLLEHGLRAATDPQLTAAQTQLLQYRDRLLGYRRRLGTYLRLVGEEHYDPVQYSSFRDRWVTDWALGSQFSSQTRLKTKLRRLLHQHKRRRQV